MKRTSKPTDQLQIINMQELKRIFEDPGFKEFKDDYVDRVKRAAKNGSTRGAVKAEVSHLEAVRKLHDVHPHGRELIDYVLGQVAISLCHKERLLQINPVVVCGEPGIAKTTLVLAIAEALSVPCVQMNCAAKNTGMHLSGLEKGYSSGHPGIVSSELVLNAESKVNTLFVLDEFEKPRESKSSGESFHNTFYELLEPLTAKAFSDRYFGFSVDASRLNWIFTVNDFEVLPEPIQSRVTRIDLHTPCDEQLKKIIPSIYKSLINRRSAHSAFSIRLSAGVIEELMKLKNPRLIYKTLDRAMCRAALRRESYTPAKKLRVLEEHVLHCMPTVKKERKIGFL